MMMDNVRDHSLSSAYSDSIASPPSQALVVELRRQLGTAEMELQLRNAAVTELEETLASMERRAEYERGRLQVELTDEKLNHEATKRTVDDLYSMCHDLRREVETQRQVIADMHATLAATRERSHSAERRDDKSAPLLPRATTSSPCPCTIM